MLSGFVYAQERDFKGVRRAFIWVLFMLYSLPFFVSVSVCQCTILRTVQLAVIVDQAVRICAPQGYSEIECPSACYTATSRILAGNLALSKDDHMEARYVVATLSHVLVRFTRGIALLCRRYWETLLSMHAEHNLERHCHCAHRGI